MDTASPLLVRLRVLPGKEDRILAWIDEVKKRELENLDSMINERITAEAVFTSLVENQLFVSWLIYKKPGNQTHFSDTELDRKHHKVLWECVDFEAIEEATPQYFHTVAGQFGSAK